MRHAVPLNMLVDLIPYATLHHNYSSFRTKRSIFWPTNLEQFQSGTGEYIILNFICTIWVKCTLSHFTYIVYILTPTWETGGCGFCPYSGTHMYVCIVSRHKRWSSYNGIVPCHSFATPRSIGADRVPSPGVISPLLPLIHGFPLMSSACNFFPISIHDKRVIEVWQNLNCDAVISEEGACLVGLIGPWA